MQLARARSWEWVVPNDFVKATNKNVEADKVTEELGAKDDEWLSYFSVLNKYG